MAVSSITSTFGSSTSPQAKLTVASTDVYPDKITYEWQLQYVTHGYVANTNGNGRAWEVYIAGKKVKSGTTNINGRSTYTVASGTTTVNRTHEGQTLTAYCTFTFDITWSGTYSGKRTGSKPSWSIGAKTKYNVTYNANGGSNAPATTYKWHNEASPLATGKPTRTGYTFNNWATDKTASKGTHAPGQALLASTNYAIDWYAIWKANTYSVVYSANGGSNPPGNGTRTFGTAFTLSTAKPTRTGYTFKGWSLTSSGSTITSIPASNTTAGTITVYAIWTINSYTITFNSNTAKSAGNENVAVVGATTQGSVSQNYNTSFAYSSKTLSSTSHNFQGWNTSATATTALSGSRTITGNVTLYAIWKRKSFTVAYNANQGTSAPASQTKYYGTTLTLTTSTPTRTNYVFDSWNTSSNGSGTKYASGANYTANAGTTLYAIWQLAGYPVTLDPSGGDCSAETITKIISTDYTSLPACTRGIHGEYTFLGWAKTVAAATPEYTTTLSEEIQSSPTLYAVWQHNYTAPIIHSCELERCTSSGVEADGDTTYVNLSYDIEDCFSATQTATITSVTLALNDVTKTLTAKHGSGNEVVNLGTTLTMDSSYNGTVTVQYQVTDGSSYTVTEAVGLSKVQYLIDVCESGVAIGKSASGDNFEVAKNTILEGVIRVYNKLIVGQNYNSNSSANALQVQHANNIDLAHPNGAKYCDALSFEDVNGVGYGFLRHWQTSNGDIQVQLCGVNGLQSDSSKKVYPHFSITQNQEAGHFTFSCPGDTSWATIPVASGSTASSPAPNYRVRSGVVYLRGRITATAPNNNTGKTIATLPAGFRPTVNGMYSCKAGNSGLANVCVQSNGTITLYFIYANSGGSLALYTSSTFVSLDGISFPIDNFS